MRTSPIRHCSSLARMCLAAAWTFIWLSAVHAQSDATYFATVSVNERTVRYEMTLPESAVSPASIGDPTRLDVGRAADGTLRAIAGKIQVAADGVPCSAAPGQIGASSSGDPGFRIGLDFSCATHPQTLKIRYGLFDIFGGGHRTLALIVWSGGTQQFMFEVGQPELRLDLIRGTVGNGPLDAFSLGLERMLIGWDHLLFLLCLLLPAKNGRLTLRIVLAFAVAHSTALIAAGTGVVALPDRVTGVLIALSIAWAAGENIFLGDRFLRKRWLVAGALGTIHGIGLSMPLMQSGFARSGGVQSVLVFNIGVEAGLGVFLVIAMPLLLWMRRNRWEAQALATISVLAFAIGLSVFAGRVVSLATL